MYMYLDSTYDPTPALVASSGGYERPGTQWRWMLRP
jgi:hypothetical protein